MKPWKRIKALKKKIKKKHAMKGGQRYGGWGGRGVPGTNACEICGLQLLGRLPARAANRAVNQTNRRQNAYDTAITTKHIGPTDHRGCHIKATCRYGNSVVVPYNYALGLADNHMLAAIFLRHKMGWAGKLAGGHTETGMVFVFV